MRAFNGDQFLEREIRRLVSEYKVQTIIETGTYKGDSTRVFAQMVPKVYSMEADPDRFNEVPRWANGLPVEVYYGDSAQVLPHLLKNKFEGQTLFYLDAHWGKHSPLLEELAAIAKARLRPIIVIHDFFNPERPEYGYDSYDIGPYAIDTIRLALGDIYGDGYTYQYNQAADGQKRGVIFIGPELSPIPQDQGPSTAVVYVTYRQDLCWIVYSLQLLVKHLRGNYRIVVRAEPDCQEIISTWGIPATYHYVKPWPDGYAFAMYMKATADQYTEADTIMLLDSDHMLLRPAALENFLKDGKPIVRYRDWREDPDDASLIVGEQQWAPPTERTLGIPLDYDYMVGPPFVFRRDTFPKLRERVEEVTGLPFHDAVYSDRPYDYRKFLSHPKVFCDYEALGLYAAKFQPELYHLMRSTPQADWPFRVYWSHGDWSARLGEEFQALVDS